MSDDYRKIHDWYMTNIQRINRLDNMASEYGISFIQYSLLLSISEKNSTPLEIAHHLNVSKTTISRALKTLETKKYIIRLHSVGDDKRQVEIQITDEGTKLVEEINSRLNQSDV